MLKNSTLLAQLRLTCKSPEVKWIDTQWNPALRPPRFYKNTSLLQPYSFKPKVKTIESFYYFEDPVNATTS